MKIKKIVAMFILTALAAVSLTGCSGKNKTEETAEEENISEDTYAVYNKDDKSLTFYHGEISDEVDSNCILFDDDNLQTLRYKNCTEVPWSDYSHDIKTVIVDESCKYTTLRDTSFWFYDFRNCESIEGMDLFSYDYNVDMSYMFYNCPALKNIDVSNWNTGMVQNMQGMFAGCSSLTNIDISEWDVSSVNNMGYMFCNCSSLEELDVSNWHTDSLCYCDGLFSGCSSLTFIDLEHWETRYISNANDAFEGCTNLRELNMGPIYADTMNYMFAYCENLNTEITISSPEDASCVNMFYECATTDDSDVVVNYTEGSKDIASLAVSERAEDSNIILGDLFKLL